MKIAGSGKYQTCSHTAQLMRKMAGLIITHRSEDGYLGGVESDTQDHAGWNMCKEAAMFKL